MNRAPAELGVLEMLERILVEQQAMRAELRELSARLDRPAQPADSEDAQLLQEIFSLVQDTPFLASELAEARGGTDAQRLGQRLAYLQGRTIGGLQVCKTGRPGYGSLWRIHPVAD